MVYYMKWQVILRKLDSWINFIGFIVAIVVVWGILSFLFSRPDSFNRIKYHEFYQENDYNIVAVGASSTLDDFNPYIADRLTGLKTYNMGTSSQPMEGTYYQTKDIIRHSPDVDIILVDVSFAILSRSVGSDKKAAQIMTDYMKFRIPKCEYIFKCYSPENWMEMFSPTYRNHSIKSSIVSDNLKAKINYEYLNYINHNEIYDNYNYYQGKGLSIKKKVNEGTDFFMFPENYGEFDTMKLPFDGGAVSYLNKTIDLCKKNNIRVILVSYPRTNLYLKQCGNYDIYSEWINEFCEKKQIEYFDLNLIKNQNWSDDLFANLDHLNYNGSEIATEYISGYIMGSRYDMLDTINERFNRDIDGVIYTCAIEAEANKKFPLTWRVITDTNTEFVYRVMAYDKESMELISESGIINDHEALLDNITDRIIINIYNKDNMEYMGNAMLYR